MRTKDRSTDYWLVLLTVTVEQDINILYNVIVSSTNESSSNRESPPTQLQSSQSRLSVFILSSTFLVQTIQKLNNEVLHSRSSLHGGFGYCLCRPL